jgi:hypothetical protein
MFSRYYEALDAPEAEREEKRENSPSNYRTTLINELNPLVLSTGPLTEPVTEAIWQFWYKRDFSDFLPKWTEKYERSYEIAYMLTKRRIFVALFDANVLDMIRQTGTHTVEFDIPIVNVTITLPTMEALLHMHPAGTEANRYALIFDKWNGNSNKQHSLLISKWIILNRKPRELFKQIDIYREARRIVDQDELIEFLTHISDVDFEIDTDWFFEYYIRRELDKTRRINDSLGNSDDSSSSDEDSDYLLVYRGRRMKLSDFHQLVDEEYDLLDELVKGDDIVREMLWFGKYVYKHFEGEEIKEKYRHHVL